MEIIFLLLFTAASGYVHAASGNTPSIMRKYDSLLPEGNDQRFHAVLFLDVLDAENNFRESGNMQRTMMKLLRIAGMKKTLRSNTPRTRLLLDIANISAV